MTIVTNSAPFSEISSKTLSSYLNFNGVDCKIIYLNNIFEDVLDERIKAQILQSVGEDKLIGMSLMTKDYYLFKDLTWYLKSYLDIPIVWGGIHPSVLPEESLRCCDYVCIGEGEQPLLKLYKSIVSSVGLKSIPNIAYKNGKNNNVVYPKSAYIVKDLNKLFPPDYKFKNDLLLVNNKLIKIIGLNNKERSKLLGRVFLFYSQRGCPFSCTYCSNNFLRKNAQKYSLQYHRKMDVGKAIKQLTAYKKRHPFINRFIINDDDFLARSEEEIKIFSKKYKEKIGLPFWVNAIPSFVTDPKIKSLIDAGLSQISMGVQTGSERILKEVYKRHLYPKEIVKSSRIINKYKKRLGVSYDLIVDNPYENENDILKTVKLLNKLPKPYDLQIHSLVFFPGTELYQKAVKDGLIINRDEQIYRKRYQTDIGSSYLNFVLMLNSLVNLPKWVNNFLSSSFMRKNILLKPLRFGLLKSVKVLIILKGFKSLLSNPQLFIHYLKQLKTTLNGK